MKATLTFVLSLLALISCNCQKHTQEVQADLMAKEIEMQETNIPTLVYEAMSRGYYYQIKIENKQVFVTPKRDALPEVKPISDKDWNELVTLYSKVNKEGLKDLKDPTQKRFYDGAPIANFRVIEESEMYASSDFDGGFPPVEIESIVNKIIEISKK